MTSFADTPEIVLGHRVIVVPSTIFVARTWRERLLSLPWRPFDRIKRVPNPVAPKPGQVFVTTAIGGLMPLLYVREEDHPRLKRLLSQQEPY